MHLYQAPTRTTPSWQSPRWAQSSLPPQISQKSTCKILEKKEWSSKKTKLNQSLITQIYIFLGLGNILLCSVSIAHPYVTLDQIQPKHPGVDRLLRPQVELHHEHCPLGPGARHQQHAQLPHQGGDWQYIPTMFTHFPRAFLVFGRRSTCTDIQRAASTFPR